MLRGQHVDARDLVVDDNLMCYGKRLDEIVNGLRSVTVAVIHRLGDGQPPSERTFAGGR
jgi:hypothetical protein